MAIRYAVEVPNQVPSSLVVYKLANPGASMKQLTGISTRFGLSGKRREFTISEDRISYHEGRFSLSIHRNSGALRYMNRDKYGIEIEGEFKLSPQKSEQLAEQFLERTRLYPFGQLRFHKLTHLRSGSSDVQGKKKTERVIDAGVIYRRLIDDTPVEGPGGYVMVNINPENEVVGFRSVWRKKLRREAKVKIIPVTQALETFERLVSSVEGELTVTAANFGYFEQGEYDKQLYIQPAYVFIYTAQNGEIAHKSIEVIPAGRETFAKLKGKKRFTGGDQKNREP